MPMDTLRKQVIAFAHSTPKFYNVKLKRGYFGFSHTCIMANTQESRYEFETYV